MNKAIITVVGQDTVGIIARVCTYLSGNIRSTCLTFPQTIIDGFFNMMMIVDYSTRTRNSAQSSTISTSSARRSACHPLPAREIFTKMHRV